NIESIKVIKGGASYLYGNDALAGAIVITTKKPKGESASKIEGEIGSFNSKRLLATTNQSFGNSALQLQASYRDTDGYWDDAYATIKSVNGKYVYYIDETSDVTFGLDYTNRKTGDGNSVSGTIEAEEDPRSVGEYSYSGYYDSDLIKGFVSYSKDFGEESNLMVQLHTYQDDKTYKTARRKYDANEVWKQNGAKGEYRTAFGPLAVMAGLDIQRNTTDELRYLAADGSLNNDYETEEAINAVYTELILQVTERLTTTFNFRYDYIEQKYINDLDSTNNVSPTYKVPSYRAGFNYTLPENNSLYANFSTGFRTPTPGQISNNAVNLMNDPTLDIPLEIDPETTYNYELGARGQIRTNGRIETLFYNASIYQLDRYDYIGQIAGNYITSDDENESNYDNVGDMRSRGFELAMYSDQSRMFSFNLAYTYLDAVFTSYTISQQITADPDGPYRPLTATYERKDLSGNRVPRTSKHMIDFTLHFKPVEAALISAEIYARSSYYADEANNYEMPGYAVMNLRGEYRFNEMFEIFGRIDNLLNKNYYQFANINSSALADDTTDMTIRVAPPRAYYAGLRIRF
ncbi:TonB-dependent receptor, partial [bacterium]|nr:TonB-dependent receptor [bacterium]